VQALRPPQGAFPDRSAFFPEDPPRGTVVAACKAVLAIRYLKGRTIEGGRGDALARSGQQGYLLESGSRLYALQGGGGAAHAPAFR